MSDKVGDGGRGKVTRYAVDWVAFDRAAQQRGAYRLALERQAVPALPPPPPKRPGRGAQKKYSDETVYSMLMLALAARLSLREVEGYVRALRDQAGLSWAVPDHSTLCRRMRALDVVLPPASPGGSRLCFLLDATGLKVSGAGEWRARHAHSGKQESATQPAELGRPLPRRRAWRKAHIAVEHGSGMIVATELTGGHADDAAQVPRLLHGQPLKNAHVCADGAYHEAAVFAYVHERAGQLLARQPYNAEPWLRRMHEPGVAWRNLQLSLRNELGQQQWARQSGYSRRSLVETHNARLKHYTGASLRCRHARAQQVEWRLRVQLVNTYWVLWAAAGGTRARAIS